MKKEFLTIVLLCMIFLSACGKTEKTEPAENLEFPDLSWDMTPADVLKAFDTEKENTVLYDENSLSTSFGITDIELFGQKAERVIFNFIDFSSFDQMPGQAEGAHRYAGSRRIIRRMQIWSL